MGKIGFMLLGGAITIVGLGVLILIIMFVSWIQEKIIMHTINKKNNLNRQLEKAKDHIKKLLGCLQQDTNDPQTNYYVVQYMTEAEQFLKE